jgi:hypothetical protein
MKHRAVSKLIKSWPKSPKKRTEVELLKFYIEIKFVKFIVFHWKCTFLLFGFSTINERKILFQMCKVLYLWFFYVKLQLDTNRTMKHRAVSKLIKSWPKSPKKRTEGVSAYLTTVKTLVKLKKHNLGLVWVGWECGVLMCCSSFPNFTFCFYWFLFYFRRARRTVVFSV